MMELKKEKPKSGSVKSTEIEARRNNNKILK
jgi:hypothetical protein